MNGESLHRPIHWRAQILSYTSIASLHRFHGHRFSNNNLSQHRFLATYLPSFFYIHIHTYTLFTKYPQLGICFFLICT